MQTVSSLISSAERGDTSAVETLFTTLYSDLRKLARHELSRHGAGITLTATALLHEAYLDISKRDGAMFVERGRFMVYASRVMRGLIIDYARNRRAQKRGGRFQITTFETDVGERIAKRTRADGHQRCARRARLGRCRARGDRRPQVLLRVLVR